MSENLYFRRQGLLSMIGGVSVLDAPRLSVRDVDQATDFVASYGYDWGDTDDQKLITSFFRQAVAFLQDRFVGENETPVIDFFTKNKIEDVRHLLVAASDRDPDYKELQKWACATLNVMHIISYLNNDLYSIFDDEIREQILTPVQSFVTEDSIQGATFLQNEHEKIRLNKFEFKPKKNLDSGIVKLLAKRKLVALNILDRIGVRFVTKNTFDIFKVLRFLVNNSLVSYPHCIVNEAVNTVYPTNLFLEVMDTLRAKNSMASSKEISDILDRKLTEQGDRAEFHKKDNIFTDPDYKFIKFISRKLIKLNVERNGKQEQVRFFYPFEIQIMGYETFLNNMRGPLSHDEYKKRQEKAAKLRLFGADS
jgi:uncharacterized protein (TIGR04562 family)